VQLAVEEFDVFPQRREVHVGRAFKL